MKKEEALSLIKNNPVFWSRLGFCYDPPLKNAQGKPLVFTDDLGKYGKYHREFKDIGVKIHTCILHSGWVGVNEYDYSLTDRVMEEIFRDNPDAYFIPRVKLNVPIDWCFENPEEVFVYPGGPDTAEGVRELVGSLKQDYIGYEAPNGYYMAGDYVDTRPNVGGLIARQSFSSKKWLKDAKTALEKLIDRLESSKYADRILGYHIAYGASGECVLWGRASERYGDYGISHRRAFYDWGIKKNGSRDALGAAWGQPDIQRENVKLPTPEERYAELSCVERFFRGDKRQTISTDFDIFISEVNVNAIEHFGKIVKDKTGGKLVGTFYGYFIHVNNSAYTGHLAIDRLLNSPYVDFLAAPKSYYRNNAGEPGGVLTATQSINRKKIWLDELDNRTHLAHGKDAEWTSENFDTTKTVFWREFSKNLADDSGFWWMDLGGGWFDSPEIMNEFSSLVKASELVKKTKHKSISDVLVLVDNECIYKMNISGDLRLGFMEDFLCELHMTGTLVDVYRMADLKELNLSQYKLIIFAYTFEIDKDTREFIKNIPADKTLMFNYTSGIISEGTVSLENSALLTGAKIEPCDNVEHSFPAVRFSTDTEAEIIDAEGGVARVGRLKRANGGINIVNLKPFINHKLLRQIVDGAGCHAYVPAGNTVYGDNRFIGVFPSAPGDIVINLREKADYVNLVNSEEFKNTDKISLSVSKTTPMFFIKK